MKKNVIAVILSLMMAMGNIGAAHVFAAEEGTATEAASEVEAVEEEGGVAEESGDVFGEEDSGEDTEGSDTAEEDAFPVDDASEDAYDQPSEEQDTASGTEEESASDTDTPDGNEYEAPEVSDDIENPTKETQQLNLILEAQKKARVWKHDNQITISYDTAEELLLVYSIYDQNTDDLLYSGELQKAEESDYYYVVLDFDAINETAEAGNVGNYEPVDIADIPVKIILDDGTYQYEEIISGKAGTISNLDVDSEIDGQLSVTWDSTGEADGFYLAARGTEEVRPLPVCIAVEAEENEAVLNISKEDVRGVLAVPYKFDQDTGAKYYGEAAAFSFSGKEDNLEREQVAVTEEAETEQEVLRDEQLEPESPDIAAQADIKASGACGDNLTWTVDSEGTLTISGTGEMTDSPWLDYQQFSWINHVVIEDGVTSIGNGAFSGCEELFSITIPNSVTSIGNGAFNGCEKLLSITIPNNVTSIGENAFCNCHGFTSITIPNSVTSIGYRAFAGCISLTSITIPNSVTSIGDGAFAGCFSLTSITIPDSVTSIGWGTFERCTRLESVKIGNSVTSIGNEVFTDCSSLTSVTIPDSVTSIGEYAFKGCNNLTSITIPGSMTSIGQHAFHDCSGLTSIIIPDSVTSIDYYAFGGCSSLTSITIPDGVTSIGNFAFARCSSLTSITIPDSVTIIGHNAFNGCTRLTSMIIGSGVTYIDYSAFVNCPNLIVYTTNEYVIEYCSNNGIEMQNEYFKDYFIIGRDSNSFQHSDVLFGIGKELGGRIGTSYTTSLYYYSKLCDGLKGSQWVELIDRMNGEWIGSCEGLAISMGMSFLKKIDIHGFEGSNGSSPTCYSDLKPPYVNLNFRDLINYYHLLQTVDKHNNPKGWLLNLTDGVRFLDGRCTLSTDIEGTTNFWQGFAKYVKEADAKSTPLLFSVSYTNNNGVPKGHTVLTCGYKETDRYYIIKLYDCNHVGHGYDYLYLFIDKLNYEFRFSTTDDTITEYTLFNDWVYFEFFDENDWEELDNSIQYVKRSSGATTKGNTDTDSKNTFLYLTISAGKEFRLENGSGQYLQFKNGKLGNTLDIYEFEALNDGSEYRLKVLNSEDLILTEFGDETKFCFRTDSNYASVSTQNADEIRVQNNSTITIAGDEFSYTLRMSKNSDNSMVELSGKSNDEATIVHDDDEVSISSHNSDDLGVTVYDVQGNISKDDIPASDTIVINENELVIHITPLELETTEVIVPDQTYTGKEQEPVPSVKVNGTTLTLDKDYTVSYKNNINVGTATVTVTGIGAYTGSIEETFEITPKPVTPTVTLSKASFTYNGKAQKPAVTVKLGETTLTEDDYDITWPSGCTKAGTYKVNVTMKGNYSGNGETSYKITAKKITPVVTLSTKVYTYNGKVRKPTVTVKDSKTKLAAANYTVTYASGRKNPGTYKVTVKLKGNYSGSKAVSFKINPKGTTLSKLTPGSKKMTVKWNKQATQITGYQIQYATDSKFTKNKKTVTVKGAAKTGKTITGLTGNKKYYVRIRTYKTVSKTNYYSAWSASKKTTIKK